MNTTILSQPQVSKVSTAFQFGAADAKEGHAFAPEMYFTRRSDKIQYAIGFEVIRGASEATRQFTHAA